jgi:hypothetical protein
MAYSMGIYKDALPLQRFDLGDELYLSLEIRSRGVFWTTVLHNHKLSLLICTFLGVFQSQLHHRILPKIVPNKRLKMKNLVVLLVMPFLTYASLASVPEQEAALRPALTCGTTLQALEGMLIQIPQLTLQLTQNRW